MEVLSACAAARLLNQLLDLINLLAAERHDAVPRLHADVAACQALGLHLQAAGKQTAAVTQ